MLINSARQRLLLRSDARGRGVRGSKPARADRICGYNEKNVAIDHQKGEVMKQTTAGIRELKNHLSAYLRKVKAGETITITDRGTPVGRIVPAGEKDERTLGEKLQALQDAGLAEWSGKKLQPREPVAENKGDRMVSDLLLEDRR